MRVVHIGFIYGLNNTGGAAIASTRLHLALLKAGVESYYMCVHKNEDGPNVYVLPQRRTSRLLYFLLTKITRCMWKLSPYKRSICLNRISMFGLEQVLADLKPDVVHVQWLNADVCSFEQLSGLPYKLVFNLHDLYPINAIEPYPGADKRYQDGFNKDNSTILERWLITRKLKLVGKTHPVFIGPSEWVCAMCRLSIVGRGYNTFPIPNIIDECFRYDSSKRTRHEKMVALFGAFGGRWGRNKGWNDCEIALRLLPRDVKRRIEIHIFGESAQTYDLDGIVIRFLGDVSDPHTLMTIYHNADIFLFPSVQETQGMTKIEAMLCGLPVVTFDRTACAEGVIHGVTGWVASNGDYKGFACGVQYYNDLFTCGKLDTLHEEFAKCAAKKFSIEYLLTKVRSVYDYVIHSKSNS